MVSHHHDAIRLGGHPAIAKLNSRKIRVCVSNASASLFQEQYDIERGRFPYVIDIAFVCYPEHMDVRTLQWLRAIVQRVLNLIDYEMRHLSVDVAGKLNESCF